ncbi:MAG: septum formation protein Maf [Gammaproteobacteria bacterium AqS3]|nr:septum formation protein Maf [Gammaproteobacteria bacterium AqS3]
MRLILASGSRYRAELLRRLEVTFETVSPEVDESACDLAGDERARHLSLLKAGAVAECHPDAWVIGSDQVAECGGLALHKPGSETRACEQLAAISGQCVEFHTAVALAVPGREVFVESTLTRVWMRTLSTEQIRDYVRRERPLDCAGAFKSEGLGIALIRRVESLDPTALVGLPLTLLTGLLKRAGLEVLAGKTL